MIGEHLCLGFWKCDSYPMKVTASLYDATRDLIPIRGQLLMAACKTLAAV